jgi:4-hydroxy-3-polyprenylbenzoate decarboxylase
MAVYTVALSGASGAPYALRLLEVLLDTPHEIKLVVSPAAEKIMRIECGVDLAGSAVEKYDKIRRAIRVGQREIALEIFDHRDLAAPISSGSFPVAGMAIVPCSTGTIGRIANGISTDLISRAADVCLKERRKLVLVPRETPLSEIHLRNMLRLSRAGAVVLPAAPGFYHRPKEIADLVDMVVSRILDQLGVENKLFKRWKGEGVSEILSMDEE